jgi:hypothetical protein
MFKSKGKTNKFDVSLIQSYLVVLKSKGQTNKFDVSLIQSYLVVKV